MGVILHIVILMSIHKGNFFISLDKGRFTPVFYGLGGGRAWGSVGVRFQGTHIDNVTNILYDKTLALELEVAMPRAAIKDNNRFAMRIDPAQKARLIRAAHLEETDLRSFMLRNSLKAADAVIEHAECIYLDEEQARFVLNLLDNPPEPNDRMIAAAKSLLSDQMP